MTLDQLKTAARAAIKFDFWRMKSDARAAVRKQRIEEKRQQTATRLSEVER